MSNFEGCLEKEAFTGNSLSTEAKKNLTDTAQALAKYLDDQLKADKTIGIKDDQERDFILGSLVLRMKSILRQLDTDMSNEGDLKQEFAPLENTVYQSAFKVIDSNMKSGK